jgi:hypothetical protein
MLYARNKEDDLAAEAETFAILCVKSKAKVNSVVLWVEALEERLWVDVNNALKPDLVE